MGTSKGHIHLIDDDGAMRHHLSRMLEDLGYSIDEFESSAQFLKSQKAVSPGVILCDMRMPDMSGLELQEKLNADGKSTPIIFISGQSNQIEVAQAFRAGALNFLFKPFGLEQLLTAISEGLEQDKKAHKQSAQKQFNKKLYATMTRREKEVYAMLVAGANSVSIAKHFDITPATIKIHKARVLKKMGVQSLAELIRTHLATNHNF